MKTLHNKKKKANENCRLRIKRKEKNYVIKLEILDDIIFILQDVYYMKV